MGTEFLQALQAKIGARLSADRDKSGLVSLPVDGGKLGIGCGHLDILLIVVVVFSQEIEKLVSFVVGIQFAVAVASTAALVRILDCRSTADWRCRTCGLSPLSSSVLWCTSTLLLVLLDVMSIVCNELLLLVSSKTKGSFVRCRGCCISVGGRSSLARAAFAQFVSDRGCRTRLLRTPSDPLDRGVEGWYFRVTWGSDSPRRPDPPGPPQG